MDYVLKPIDEDRLLEAIDRAVEQRRHRESAREKEKLVELMMGITGASASSIEQMAGNGAAPRAYPEKLTIKDGSEIQFIRVADIEWVDAAGDYMCIHAGGKTHIMRITMKQLEAMLDPGQFLRNGAQTLTNGEYLLTLEGGTQLKVSRSYRDRIKHLLGG